MLRWRLLIFFALLLLTVQAVDEPALAVQATDEQPPPQLRPYSVKLAAQRGVQNSRGLVPPEAERVQTR